MQNVFLISTVVTFLHENLRQVYSSVIGNNLSICFDVLLPVDYDIPPPSIMARVDKYGNPLMTNGESICDRLFIPRKTTLIDICFFWLLFSRLFL